jgi:U3 small nucleolar RNA-associated protein 12
MVKNYYKFEPRGTQNRTQHLNSCVGIITSPHVHQIYYNREQRQNRDDSSVYTCGLEHVMQWNLKTNELNHVIHVNNNNNLSGGNVSSSNSSIDHDGRYGFITCMVMSEDGTRMAVGYQTGRVIVYNNHQSMNNNNNKKKLHAAVGNENWTLELNCMGHSSSVTSLCFNDSNTWLASGGDDSDIVLWDVVANVSLCRLRGHKSRVTSLLFLHQTIVPLLISSSKDMLIKLWELDTLHCIQTLIGSRSEIWSLVKTRDEKRLIAGSSGTELRVWNMEPLLLSSRNMEQNVVPIYEIDPIYLGTFLKQSEDRVLNMKYDPSGRLLAVISDNKTVELFRMRTPKELEHKLKLRRRDIERRWRAQSKQNETMADIPQESTEQILNRIETSLQFAPFYSFAIESHVRSIDLLVNTLDQDENNGRLKDVNIRCVVGTLRNSILEFELYCEPEHEDSRNIEQKEEEEEKEMIGDENRKKRIQHRLITRIDKHGHSTPIRSLSISHQRNMILSTSSKHARIWNINENDNTNSMNIGRNNRGDISCIRVLNSSYGLSSLFVPGDKHVIIGTKRGHLELFDINSGQLLMDVSDAHKGPVWTLVMKPDKKGIISASSDMCVKFWDFELTRERHQLTLTLEHTLQMNEDIVSIAVSPKGKYLAVSLLDNTVKIFYLDSLKFFLSLYGHKLPVNAIDMSSDEQLIITASADKNVKIWGLDFGDCHKSILSHEGSITQIAFVKDTHYYFTCSKDGSVKYWDADSYQMIQLVRPVRLDSPLWCMALDSGGQHHMPPPPPLWNNNTEDGQQQSVQLYVAGHDRVIWCYEQNLEQLLFMEEEEERRQEEEYEQELIHSQQFLNLADPTVESTHAGKRSIETIRDGEKLMSSLRVAMEHEAAAIIIMTNEKQHDATAGKLDGMNSNSNSNNNSNNNNNNNNNNPLLLGYTVNEYVWRCLTRIAPSELDLVMAILPYRYALYILEKLNQQLSCNEMPPMVEYISRIVLILIQIHQKTILLDHKVFPLINSLNQHMRKALLNERNMIGFNTAALSFVRNHIRNEMEFRMWNNEIVAHVSELQKSQKVLSYREKQKEQIKFKKLAQKQQDEALNKNKKKPKKGRFQGILDNLMTNEEAEEESSNVPLTFEVKESLLQKKQKKRKREKEEQRDKKLKQALLKEDANNSSDDEEEMEQILNGI